MWFSFIFTLQVFFMDILSSQQIRLGLPPSYLYHHPDHCSCIKSLSTQALVVMRHFLPRAWCCIPLMLTLGDKSFLLRIAQALSTLRLFLFIFKLHKIFTLQRFFHNIDIGHCLDCVLSVIWILVTTLTISQVIFYIARFFHNMDIGHCLLDCVPSVMWIFVTLLLWRMQVLIILSRKFS